MYLINNLPNTLQLLSGTISIPPFGHLKISPALQDHQDVHYAVHSKGWAYISELPPSDIKEREAQAPTMKLSTPEVGLTIEELREAQAKEAAEKAAEVQLEPQTEAVETVEAVEKAEDASSDDAAEGSDDQEASKPTRRGRQAKS